jgi:acyl-CoA synthetase (AMP-forming)/AMP-acid ligase II
MQEFPWTNLKALLEDKAVKNGNKTVLFFEDGLLTYRDLHETSNAIAHNLQRLGIQKGDHVLLFLFNGPEFLKAWFALAKLGAVTVPLNTALRRLDLTYIVQDSDAKAIILDEALAENYLEVRKEVHLPREILLTRGPGPSEGMIAFQSLERGPLDNLKTEIRHSDPACILYTSGTTGKPKGAILPHFSYINSGLAIAKAIGVSEGDRLFTTLPLFHVGAQLVVAIPAIVGDVGFALVRRFSASKFWDQIREHNCNIVHYLGSLTQILYQQPPRPGDRDHLPIRMVGGGVPKDLWEKFEKRFGVTFLEGYGLTEGACITTWSPMGKVKVGSIGLPVAHQRVEVVNEDDEIVAPGVGGEIVIRPELPFSMTSGYYKRPGETLAAFRNLWFHTGDIAYKDEEGYLYFVGRKSQFIRRRGENISAEEVEEVINQHPKVKETGVVGVPSEVGEEEIKACIVFREGAVGPEEIIRWCEERIAYFKVPRYVEFLDELPKTETNRIQKHKLKEMGIVNAWDREKAGYKIRR